MKALNSEFFKDDEKIAVIASVWKPELKKHSHDFFEITFITKGNGYHVINNNHHTIKQTKPVAPYTVRFRWINQDGMEEHKRLTGTPPWMTQSAAQKGYEKWVFEHPTNSSASTKCVEFFPLYCNATQTAMRNRTTIFCTISTRSGCRMPTKH